MKTAVSVLQEMLLKMYVIPEYECVSQSGPQHETLFEYSCRACNEVVTATARSKKEAKQEVARLMLERLASRGHSVPHSVPAPSGIAAVVASFHEKEVRACPAAGAGSRNYVSLLKELCEQRRVAAVRYEEVGRGGAAHCPQFSVRASLPPHQRTATASTKKAAKQLAAEKLYTDLTENLQLLTTDSHEVFQDGGWTRTYRDHDEEPQRRPDLHQKIADYHLGITSVLDPETKKGALALLERERERDSSPERVLAALSAALRLQLRRNEGAPAVLQLDGAPPRLAFAGPDPPAAAREALHYLRDALAWP